MIIFKFNDMKDKLNKNVESNKSYIVELIFQGLSSFPYRTLKGYFLKLDMLHLA